MVMMRSRVRLPLVAYFYVLHCKKEMPNMCASLLAKTCWAFLFYRAERPYRVGAERKRGMQCKTKQESRFAITEPVGEVALRAIERKRGMQCKT